VENRRVRTGLGTAVEDFETEGGKQWRVTPIAGRAAGVPFPITGPLLLIAESCSYLTQIGRDQLPGQLQDLDLRIAVLLARLTASAG
jgi:hypothetical protein